MMKIEKKNNVDMSRYKKGNHNSDYEWLLSFCGSIWGRKNKERCVLRIEGTPIGSMLSLDMPP